MVIPHIIVAPDPIEAPRLTRVGSHFHSPSLGQAFVIGRARKAIIDERDIVTDKHFVLQGYAFTKKGMALNFAIVPNRRAFLNLNKGADAHSVADDAPVKIHESVHPHVTTEFDVRRDEASG